MVGTKPCGRLAESRESEPPSCAVRADSDSRQSQRLFPRVLRKRKPGHLHPVDTKLPYRWCPREGLAAPRRRSRVGQGRATFVWVSPPGWATPPHWEGLPGSEAQTRRSGSQSQRRAPKLARPPEPPSTSIARPQCTASPSRATPALAAATGGEAGDQTQASSSRLHCPPPGKAGFTMPSAGPAQTASSGPSLWKAPAVDPSEVTSHMGRCVGEGMTARQHVHP